MVHLGRRGREGAVERRHLGRVDAGGAREPEPAGADRHRLEGRDIAEAGQGAGQPERHHPGGAGGIERDRAGDRKGLLGGFAFDRGGEILRAQPECDHAGRGPGDLLGLGERFGRLDQHMEPQPAHLEPGGGFAFADQLVEQRHMVRPPRLGDDDAIHPRHHGGANILHRHRQRRVDPHQHIGAGLAHHGGRGRYRAPRGRLFAGRDRVLQIKLDAVGAARMRLLDKPPDMRRHIQAGPPDRFFPLHCLEPFLIAAVARWRHCAPQRPKRRTSDGAHRTRRTADGRSAARG